MQDFVQIERQTDMAKEAIEKLDSAEYSDDVDRYMSMVKAVQNQCLFVNSSLSIIRQQHKMGMLDDEEVVN